MIFTYYLIDLPPLLGAGGIFSGVLIHQLRGRVNEEEEEVEGGREEWKE